MDKPHFSESYADEYGHIVLHDRYHLCLECKERSMPDLWYCDRSCRRATIAPCYRHQADGPDS